MRRNRRLPGFVACAAVACVSGASVSADRAHDLAQQASQQRVATCSGVTSLDACHPGFPTGCSGSKKPRYDAYLNFLKDQDPDPSFAPDAILTEQDWMTKEAQLPDLGLTKGNHADSAQALATLGEGNIHAVVGYLYYRLTNTGETSNCQLTGPDNNDFHIGLGFDPALAAQLRDATPAERHALQATAQENSIILEMTPQYRLHHHPQWTATAVDALIGHQVKAVGQLIVDSEHMSGSADCGNPDPLPGCWRKSVWELHPVTQFYFCPSDACAPGSTDWQPIDGGSSFTGSGASGSGGGSGLGSARLVSKAGDASRVTVIAPGAAASTTLPVAPDVRSHVADLHAGDVVQVKATPGAQPEVRDIEVKSVPVSWARRAGALIVSLAILLALLWLLHASPRQLVLGEDGRYSKSKFQVALWFMALLTGYLATVGLRWWASGYTLVGGVGIPTELLVISGISAFTFVGAKGVTMSKIARSPAFAAVKQTVAASHFPDDLVRDDLGHPDLGDTQMVLITLIAVGTYLVTVFSWLGVLNLTAQTQMPNVDSTLVGVFGLGQGAYLVKKQLES